MASTVGVLWRGWNGTVDPWTLANINAQQTTSMDQAMPNAVPQQKQNALAASLAEIDNYLRSIGAHPGQTNWWDFIKKFALYGALALIILSFAFGFFGAIGRKAAAGTP
jgi:hypothetical protein